MNPPFSQIGNWFARLVDHGNGIGLAPAAVQTVYWQDTIWPNCTGVLFIRARIRFWTTAGIERDGTLPSTIALAAFGDLALERLRNAEDLGALVVPDRKGSIAA